MLQIRPVSDLRNKFTEIEREVSTGEPVVFTKNGYGAMVVMSIEKYTEITANKEPKSDKPNNTYANPSDSRSTHGDILKKFMNKK